MGVSIRYVSRITAGSCKPITFDVACWMLISIECQTASKLSMGLGLDYKLIQLSEKIHRTPERFCQSIKADATLEHLHRVLAKG